MCLAMRLKHWMYFNGVSFAGLPIDAVIYIGHVYRTNDKTLVAIMPIAQRLNKGQATKGGIYIAESYGGLDFGPPVLLK